MAHPVLFFIFYVDMASPYALCPSLPWSSIYIGFTSFQSNNHKAHNNVLRWTPGGSHVFLTSSLFNLSDIELRLDREVSIVEVIVYHFFLNEILRFVQYCNRENFVPDTMGPVVSLQLILHRPLAWVKALKCNFGNCMSSTS